MCRIAGFLGHSLPLAEVLSIPPRSLLAQARVPKDLPPEEVASDGFGFGWFVEGRAEPARYRSTHPVWADANVDTMARHIRSRSFVASARTATHAMPVATTNTPPFLARATLLVHNGSIRGFHEGPMDALRGGLRPETRSRIAGNTDTEHLAALLAETDPAEDLAVRVRALVQRARSILRDARASAQLTLLAAEPEALVAVRAGIDADPPALAYRTDARGTFVASEPLDEEPGWTRLEEETLLVVRTEGAVLATL